MSGPAACGYERTDDLATNHEHGVLQVIDAILASKGECLDSVYGRFGVR